MSFIYSQALVEAFLPGKCSDTDASAPLSGSPTPRPCLWHDKTMEPSRLSRFGMTCRPLTDGHGTALLTWWQGASLARTSASRGGVQALTENAQECGTTWPASLARYDPATHSLKTAQLSLLEDLTGCLLTLPRSGLMRGGELWEQTMLAPPISEKESGFWPTPLANNHTGAGHGPNKTGAPNLQTMVAIWPTPTASDHCNRQPPVNFHQCKSGMLKHLSETGEKSQVRLSQMVHFRMWPTPTYQDGEQAGGKGCIASGKRGLSLHQATQQFPTPVRSDYKSGSFSQSGRDKRDNHSRGKPLNETIGGQLNPDWVEWLMGWPIGQTELKPLETGKFHEWQQQHSIY